MMAFVKETEAAPRHNMYSSSSTACFDYIFEHQLCINGYLETVLNQRVLSLEQLLQEPPPTCNDAYVIVSRSNASAKDMCVGEYVKCLIPPNLPDVNITVDKELQAFKELRAFSKSVNNRPDVVVLKGGLPLLIVEVQSGAFRHSVSKTVVGLIDQLRLLRNYSQDINHCTGFTFPGDKEECVAKVCVEWKDLSFHISYSPLISSLDVQSEVSQAINESLSFHRMIGKQARSHFFIALSRDDLGLVHASVDKEIKCQVMSRQSIVLQGTKHFWKYIPNDHERSKLYRIFGKRGTLHIRYVKQLDFLGVESYERPLSKQDAKRCLYSLVEEVIEVIKYHHANEGVAHLDVRLENICFKRPKTVVMIDWDRHMGVDMPATLSSTYEGVMYKAFPGWQCKNLDWKQLGLMIMWIISDCDYDYHQGHFTVQDAFLKGLLFRGECDSSKLPGILSNYRTSTLEEVLEDRAN